MSLEINSMFRKYAGTLADIDLAENQATQSANTVKREKEVKHKAGKKSLSENMAGKGLAHSGISLGENVKMQKAFDSSNADADAALQTVLTNIAKKRLSAQQEWDQYNAASKLAQLGIQ